MAGYDAVSAQAWDAGTRFEVVTEGGGLKRLMVISRAGEARPAPQGRFRHVKSGNAYEVVGEAQLQRSETAPLVEGDTLVVYRREGGDGELFAREAGEFDGRFERVRRWRNKKDGRVYDEQSVQPRRCVNLIRESGSGTAFFTGYLDDYEEVK